MAQSTLTKNRPSSSGNPKPHARRLDIQGLRAIAVLAVVANHLTGFPGGGFVGVDIFFVISGFVITLGLMREHETTGQVSFRDFYFRRVARILPAGILAIVATVTVSYFAFFAERANGIMQDGLWALFFSANWRFALTGTDYWTEDAPVSALQHYWSLGVEEQFYFVWPLILVLVLGFAVKFGASLGGRRIILAVVLAAIIGISFAWALSETASNASWAYFSTPSRTWELGIGALLAVLNPLFRRISNIPAATLGWAGMAGIVASIAIIAKTFAFPAPWAALPVVSTALVIIAGTGGPIAGFQFLTNKVSAYIGNASYSLYLWHFPVIIVGGAIWPEKDITFYVVMVLLMAFLAAVSYEYVEKPAQSHLTAMYKARSWWPRRWKNNANMGPKRQYFGLAALFIATAVVVPLALHKTDTVNASTAAVAVPVTVESSKPSESPVGPASAELSEQISASLAATAWPELSPSTLSDDSADWPAAEYGSCLVKNYDRPDGCVFGPANATKTVAVLGDSLGARLVYLLHKAYPDYRIHGFVRSGCIATNVTMTPRSAEDAEGCSADRISAVESTNKLNPDFVFIMNNGGGVRELQSKAKGTAATNEWAAGLASTISSIEGDHSRVVVVSPPPEGKNLNECATKVSRPSDCAATLPADWKVASAGDARGAEQSGAKYLNTSRWYCSTSNVCPAFVGATIVKRDSVHPTAPFLDKLVAPMKESLAAAGVQLS